VERRRGGLGGREIIFGRRISPTRLAETPSPHMHPCSSVHCNAHMPFHPRIMETLTRMDTHVLYVCFPQLSLCFPTYPTFLKVQTWLRIPPDMYHAYVCMHMHRCRTQARRDTDKPHQHGHGHSHSMGEEDICIHITHVQKNVQKHIHTHIHEHII